MNNKTRVQFDFSEEALDRVDKLRDITDASSRVEVIRNSLRVYDYMVKKQREGYKIEMKRRGHKILIEPLPL